VDSPHQGPTSAISTASNNTSQLRDEDYVRVTLVKSGRDVSNHVYKFDTQLGSVEKIGSQFFEATDPRGMV
jgi:hypothetical protein